MSARVPPRFVPILTEVVRAPDPVQPQSGDPPTQALALPPAPAAPLLSEEEIVRRVMARVESELQPRLEAALREILDAETRSLQSRLSIEMAALSSRLVSPLVAKAVADALDDLSPR